MAVDPSPYSQDSAAAPVLELMRLERWRKARDAAKDLCKKDRGRYLQLLIDANIGLVREMIGKGLLKEAATVVDYLATIAPAGQVAALRVELASPAGKRQAQAPGDAGAAEWWAAAMRADEGMAAGKQLPADLAALDLLVTDPFQPAPAEADERGRRLAGELAAVRLACDATGDGRWDEAREALRRLPRQSVFWQWRLFLRGVRCVFEDEPETARQCFGQLQPGGALARAATVFGPDTSKEPKLAPASAKVSFFLAATGQPAAWCAPILTAVASWKAGQRVKAFTELAAAMKEDFPSREPGLPAVLSDALLPYKARMASRDFDDSEQLVKRFGGPRPKSLKAETVLAVMRGMCVAEVNELEGQALDLYWRLVIDFWNVLDGPNPRRDSLAWQWLGERMIEPRESSIPFRDPFDLAPDLEKARKALESAVMCDPGNEAAALSLVRLLIRKGDAKSSKPLLDGLVKRFPRNKEVLLLAGDQALERKSFSKALLPLRAALALDPLDKQVKTQIATVLLAQIRDAAGKRKPAAAFWAELEPLLENRPSGSPPGLTLSRWMARVRRSLLESDPEAAEQARREAAKLAPSVMERLFFEAIEAGSLRLKLRAGWSGEWTQARKEGLSTWAEFYRLLEILDAAPSQTPASEQAASTRLVEALKTLIGTHLKKDPDGLLIFFRQVRGILSNMGDLATEGLGICLSELFVSLRKYAAPGQRKADPRLRLAFFTMRERNPDFASHTPEIALRDLDEIIIDIKKSDHFHSAMTFAEGLRKQFLSECGELEELDDVDSIDPIDSPGFHDELRLQQMIEQLSSALDKPGEQGSIDSIRSLFKKLGLPQEALDHAIEKNSAKRPPKKIKQPKSPPSNPNQLDLF